MVDVATEEGDFLQAIQRYTEAISLNRNNHLLFYNRSAAYARVGKFSEALEDAKRCHELKPDWPKVRLCVHCLREYVCWDRGWGKCVVYCESILSLCLCVSRCELARL